MAAPAVRIQSRQAVIIHVGNLREVIAGSQDQTPSEVLIDDNQMVKNTNLTVFRDYVRYFDQVIRSRWSTACTGIGGK